MAQAAKGTTEDVKQRVLDSLDPIMFRMYQKFPFWGILLEKFSFYLVPDDHPQIWCAGVDADFNIYINPKGWFEHNTEQQTFVMAHEVAHKIFRHHERIIWREPQRWNVAGDLSINFLLVDEMGKQAMPPNGLHSSEVGDLITEDIYEMIEPALCSTCGGSGSVNQKRSASGQQTQGRAHGQDQGDEQNDQDLQQGRGRGQKRCPICEGQGQGRGRGLKYDISKLPSIEGSEAWTDLVDESHDLQNMAGKLRDSRDPTPGNEQEWKHEMSRALVSARMQGHLPAALDRAVSRRLDPQVDWLEAIRLAIRNSMVGSGRQDYEWIPPNRRYISRGWFFPTMGIQQLPKIAFIADTSGSRHEQHLIAAYSEIDAARKLFNAMIYVMDCDAAVYSSEWVMPHEELPALKGGGGTDFRPIFEHLMEHEIDPDLCVVFTDTWGSFPDRVPEFPTLWVVDVPGAQIPEWDLAEMVRIDVGD